MTQRCVGRGAVRQLIFIIGLSLTIVFLVNISNIVSVNVEMQHSMIPDNEKTHFTAHCVFNFALPVQ